MSESSYQKVFEVIQSSLVPKSQYDDLQNEVACLKSEFESVRNEWKSKFEEQKLAMDILQAEKESLESEKNTFESKFKEVSLKLKQKTNQYDSLLKSTETTGTQTIKEEPIEIGIVNVPTSSSSHRNEYSVKTGMKRSNSNLDDDKRKTSKRIKNSKSNNVKRKNRKSVQTKRNFSCYKCMESWGDDISQFGADPTKIGAPDPKQKIPTFTSFTDYKNHFISVHDGYIAEFIENPCLSCLHGAGHCIEMHGEIKCEICSLSFKSKADHDFHKRFEHADIISMNNNEIYELYGTIHY